MLPCPVSQLSRDEGFSLRGPAPSPVALTELKELKVESAWVLGGAQVALGAEDGDMCVPDVPGEPAVLHGYGHPQQHNASALGEACRQGARRVRGAGLVPAATEVGAVRIGAPGWEGWVLQGLQVGLFAHGTPTAWSRLSQLLLLPPGPVARMCSCALLFSCMASLRPAAGSLASGP